MGREKTRQHLAIRKAFAPKKKVQKHEKQHKFESFSQRLQRLKIDPIRKDRTREHERDLELLESHFRIALDKWRDLNLSEDFTRFSRQVDGISENLPLVLHHQDKIVELVLEGIEKSTAVSAEPFLDLVAHLAQDLQAQYEKHFERTVRTVAAVAAKHQEVEVVEWCFNCLTWLFKYLERILATDIRPLYDLLAPYLGKEKQKPFVSRFAAESLSFLVKRVGKKADATAAFVKHALGDLIATTQEKDTELYESSLTALFLEAIRSVRQSIHSTGETVFAALLDEVVFLGDQTASAEPVAKVLRNAFIQLVYHCTKETLSPLLDRILAGTSTEAPMLDHNRMIISSQLLLIAATVKGGSSVASWANMLQYLTAQVDRLTAAGPTDHQTASTEVLSALAVVHQSSSLDAALASSTTLDKLLQPEWQSFFPGFCNLYADYGADRFTSFLLPRFQKFLIGSWDGQTRPLCALVPKLVREGQLTARGAKLPSEFEKEILRQFKALQTPDPKLKAPYYNGLYDLLDAAAVSDETTAEIHKSLLQALEAWIAGPPSESRSLVIGHGLLYLSESTTNKTYTSLARLLASTANQHLDFPLYFQALAAFFKNNSGTLHDLDVSAQEVLTTALMNCLSSKSHDTRISALETLDMMIGSDQGDYHQQMASAIDVENTPPSLETARFISMKVQNLGRAYSSYSSSPILAQAIPRWLLGLLHVKLASVWEDACAALKIISETKEGEEIICEVVFGWINHAPVRDAKIIPTHTGDDAILDDYFSKLQAKLMDSITFTERTDELLQERFEDLHQRVPIMTPFNRTQALKVLKNVPQLAEKKSRHLVPVLLSWTADTGAEENAMEGSDSEESSTLQNLPDDSLRWPRKDQKAMLGLFASFGNPKVLYKSEEVHQALLSLLEHGDAEIQKSALQAIFAWKDKTVKKYSDELLKFLDDARLREQLTVFLDGSGENGLQAEDRSIVIPIVLRLVYGRIIARSRNGRGNNRRAVFVNLAKFNATDIDCFLDVMMGPMTDPARVPNVHLKRQVGMLNMIKDLLETWKTTASAFVPKLAPTVHACLLAASSSGDEDSIPSTTAVSKTVRLIALQCLNLCFEFGQEMDWEPFMRPLYDEVIKSRLPRFAEENAQAVSSLLRMFATWAQSPQLAKYLQQLDLQLAARVIELLALPFAKEQVKRYVLKDILQPLIAFAEADDFIQTAVEQHSSNALTAITALLDQQTSKELTEDAVSTIVAWIPYTSSCPPALLLAASTKVQAPVARVPHGTKVKLLQLILHFFESLAQASEIKDQVYNALCASFAYFGDARSRMLLVQIAQKFAAEDKSLREVIDILDDLNAFLPGRLDAPDFDRRSDAFRRINEESWQSFTLQQWRLLLGNLMFYIKDNEELAIRASASQALRRFIEASATKPEAERDQVRTILKQMLGQIETGLSQQPELVVAEYLSVLAQMARSLQGWELVDDFEHLLMAGDEEANVFNNILHVQQHRRTRALNRLTDIATQGKLTPKNIYHLILPLLENFVFKSSDGVLAAEAMKCIAMLIEWMDWQQCRVLLRRYIGYVKSKEDMQEQILKLLDAVTASICHSAELRIKREQAKHPADGDTEVMDEDVHSTALSRSMPNQEKLSQYIIDDVLPPLSIFLREKDESFVSRRISVALIATKFVQLLPELQFQLRFPPLLTDVCNILRSKDQGSRDTTRRALSSICSSIGASAFGFILRELRSTLQRGFYLHVLSYSVHSILEATISGFQPGDLDYCVGEIVDVVIEDVFGNIGKEKDAKEYLADRQTKKEVKGKKSFDTIQILASVTSLGHLVELVRPLQGVLAGHLNSKDARYVDELFRRIELGVLQNKSLKSREVLVFCYEIIKEAHQTAPASFKPPPKGKRSSAGLVDSAFLIQDHGRKTHETALHASEASGKIVRFALEIVRSVLKKNKDLATPTNISGFMPVIGDALLNPNEEVKLAAIRLFTGILNVPLKRIDEDAPVYIAEAARIVEESQTQSGELEQAALKLISSVLRERKSAPVKVKERTIAVLLKKMKGDLQVISQQGVAFNLLRSIISRQIVVPELYEIMDGDEGVAAISVRDHDRTTRDLARGVYFQFLMDYPQGKGRFAKQISFLARNLEYEYAEGRKSVMETLHLLLTKIGDALVQDVVKEVFWPVVSVMVNDEDADCREMGARLVKEVFERADDAWVSSFNGLCQKLLAQGSAVQKRTALQCWMLYLEVVGDEAEGIDFVINKISNVLAREQFDADEWQLVYWALHTFSMIATVRPGSAYEGKAQVWSDVKRHLSFPHLWVKQEAASLLGVHIKTVMSNGAPLNIVPIAGPYGLELDARALCDLAYRHLGLLKDGVTSELAAQAVRNLAFFGKVFAESEIMWPLGGEDAAPAVQEPEAGDEFQGFSEDDDDKEDKVEANGVVEGEQTALNYLLSQLAAILRREPGSRAPSSGPRQASSLIPKNTAMQLLTALSNTLPATTLAVSATAVLSPIIHLTSPDLSIPAHSTSEFKSTHEELVRNATELQDALREKLGTTVFVKALQDVQGKRSQVREERRVKRKVDVIARPEIVARKKAKKGERAKEQRRERNLEGRGRRRGW